jgi:hypothetical protein
MLILRSHLFFLALPILGAALLNPGIARGDDEIKPGDYGRSGESKTIFLSKPQSIQLNLSGTDGADGESFGGHWLGNMVGAVIGSAIKRQDQRDREKAAERYPNYPNTSPHYKTTHPKVESKSSSAGQDGGNGGNGGNGGTLTVYYQDLNDLKNIQVIAKAGKGGRGGSGGAGKSGTSCTPAKETDKPPVCTETEPGPKGSNGSAGRDGALGMLKLIKGTTAIAGDNPNSQQNIQSLAQAPITLTRNRWDEKSGAIGLLALGSVMDDRYQEYRDRIEKKVNISWNAPENISEYADQSARVALNDNGAIGFEFSNPQLWTVIQQSEKFDNTQIAIRQIVREQEVTKLTPGITNQSNRSFSLNVIDTAAKSDVLNTQFSVRVRSVSNTGRSGFGSGGTTVYEGDVPTNLVMRDYNRFILNLGGLPIDSDVFRVGADLEVEITATRSLGARSTQKKIDWSGTVY